MPDLETIGIAGTLIVAAFFKMAVCDRRDQSSSIDNQVWLNQYQRKQPEYRDVHGQKPPYFARKTLNWPVHTQSRFLDAKDGFPRWRQDWKSSWSEWNAFYYYTYLNYLRHLRKLQYLARTRLDTSSTVDEDRWPKDIASVEQPETQNYDDFVDTEAKHLTTKSRTVTESIQSKASSNVRSTYRSESSTERESQTTELENEWYDLDSQTKPSVENVVLPVIMPNSTNIDDVPPIQSLALSETKVKSTIKKDVSSSTSNETKSSTEKLYNVLNTLVAIFIVIVVILAAIIIFLIVSQRKKAAGDEQKVLPAPDKNDNDSEDEDVIYSRHDKSSKKIPLLNIRHSANPESKHSVSNDSEDEDIVYSRHDKSSEKIPLLVSNNSENLQSKHSVSVPHELKRKYSDSMNYLAPVGTKLSGPQPPSDYMYRYGEKWFESSSDITIRKSTTPSVPRESIEKIRSANSGSTFDNSNQDATDDIERFRSSFSKNDATVIPRDVQSSSSSVKTNGEDRSSSSGPRKVQSSSSSVKTNEDMSTSSGPRRVQSSSSVETNDDKSSSSTESITAITTFPDPEEANETTFSTERIAFTKSVPTSRNGTSKTKVSFTNEVPSRINATTQTSPTQSIQDHELSHSQKFLNRYDLSSSSHETPSKNSVFSGDREDISASDCNQGKPALHTSEKFISCKHQSSHSNSVNVNGKSSTTHDVLSSFSGHPSSQVTERENQEDNEPSSSSEDDVSTADRNLSSESIQELQQMRKVSSSRFLESEKGKRRSDAMSSNRYKQEEQQRSDQSKTSSAESLPGSEKYPEKAASLSSLNKSLERLVKQGTEVASSHSQRHRDSVESCKHDEDSGDDDNGQTKPWLRGNVREYYRLTPEMNSSEDLVTIGDITVSATADDREQSTKKPLLHEISIRVYERTRETRSPEDCTPSCSHTDVIIEEEEETFQKAKIVAYQLKKIE